MKKNTSLLDFEKTLHNFSIAEDITSIEPIINRLLIGAQNGMELYVPVESPTKFPLEFLVFSDDNGAPVLPIFTKQEYIPDSFPGVCVQIKANDIVRNIISHTDGFLVFNSSHDNVSLPISILAEIKDEGLHTVISCLKTRRKLDKDALILPDDELDSYHIGKTSLMTLDDEYIIFTILPEGKSDNDILKIEKSYIRALDLAKKNNLHLIQIEPFGRVEYGMPADLSIMMAVNAIVKWSTKNPDYIMDIYFACDDNDFKIHERLLTERE